MSWGMLVLLYFGSMFLAELCVLTFIVALPIGVMWWHGSGRIPPAATHLYVAVRVLLEHPELVYLPPWVAFWRPVGAREARARAARAHVVLTFLLWPITLAVQVYALYVAYHRVREVSENTQRADTQPGAK